MKIGLATTWSERCGIAEYAKNLIESLPRTIEVEIIPRPLTQIHIMERARQCDVLVINYEPGLFPWLSHQSARELLHSKKVLILHTSREGNNRNTLTDAFERVVVHEQTTEGFVHIPHGINDYKPAAHPIHHMGRIGTFGFPFPWKGMTEVIYAVKSIGVGFGTTIIASESDHCEVPIDFWRTIDPNVQVITNFLTQEKVIDILGRCQVNVFAYSGSPAGISGAVRQGLAARRPIVLTRCRQFRDLFDYEDEITFIDDAVPTTIAAGIERALDTPEKIPNRVLKDMNWKVASQKYAELFASLI